MAIESRPKSLPDCCRQPPAGWHCHPGLSRSSCVDGEKAYSLLRHLRRLSSSQFTSIKWKLCLSAKEVAKPALYDHRHLKQCFSHLVTTIQHKQAQNDDDAERSFLSLLPTLVRCYLHSLRQYTFHLVTRLLRGWEQNALDTLQLSFLRLPSI